jgi:hypothetical protein
MARLRRVLLIAGFAAPTATLAVATAQASAASQVFGYVGAQQNFVVPSGVTSVHVVAVGAQGGPSDDGTPGGAAAKATADLPVTSGQVLYVNVGGNGLAGEGELGGAGFNGGGETTGGCVHRGGGGGGASDVRTVSRPLGSKDSASSLESRLIVAGGGGGAGGSGTFVRGGAGGNAVVPGGSGNGAAGIGPKAGGGGEGGGQAAGGRAGTDGNGTQPPEGKKWGQLGQGGFADGCEVSGAGAGGGGFFGGGAGGINRGSAEEGSGGGGGGGSSFFAPSTVNTLLEAQLSGTPSVTISYTLPPSGGSTGGGPGTGGAGPGTSGGAGASPSARQVAELLAGALSTSARAARIGTLLKRGITITFRALEPGKALIAWYYLPPGAALARRAKPVLVASGQRTFLAAGSGPIGIKVTAAGRRLLAHAKRLKLTAKGTFTPAGAASITAKRPFILKR